MERVRAEFGEPRFVGKGNTIEGTLSFKVLIDCADLDELRLIEDLSALAKKVVIVTIEELQQEMKFERPKPRKQEDARQAEILPKVWEVRVNPVEVAADMADAERFWSFVAREAQQEIPAALLLAPFLPGSDGEQLVSMRVTTPEHDMITGYLVIRVAAEFGEGFVVPLTMTFVGDGEAPAEVPESWLMVGKQVLVAAGLAPDWANVADHGGFALATVVEILNGEDGQPQDVELEFRGEADGEVATLIVHASEVLPPITAEPAEEWPVVGSWARIPEAVASDAMDGMVIADGFACGEILTLSDDGLATVRVVLADGEIQDLSFAVEDLLAPVVADEEPWPVVGSWVQVPGNVAWDADARVKVVNGLADGEVTAIDDGAAMVTVTLMSGDTASLGFSVEVLVNPQAETVAADDAEPAAGDAVAIEEPTLVLEPQKKRGRKEIQAATPPKVTNLDRVVWPDGSLIGRPMVGWMVERWDATGKAADLVRVDEAGTVARVNGVMTDLWTEAGQHPKDLANMVSEDALNGHMPAAGEHEAKTVLLQAKAA